MKLVDKRVLRGPNRYALDPMLVAVIDTNPDAAGCSVAGSFTTHLRAALSSRTGALAEAVESSGECPPSVGGAIGWTIALLQRAAGSRAVDVIAAAPISTVPGHWRIAVAYEHEPVALRALQIALDVVAAVLVGARPAELEPQLRTLRTLVAREQPSMMQASVLAAAARRGVPVLRLADDSRLLQLGWGARAQRVFGSVTTRTGQVAAELTGDRALTRELLAQGGLPVPRRELVSDAEAAVAFALRLRRPVVLKPARRSRPSRVAAESRGAPSATRGERLAARGVTLGAGDAAAVRAAFACAAAHGRRVLVERHIVGATWRAHVVADRVVAMQRLDAPEPEDAPPDPVTRLHPDTARTCVRAAQAIGLEAAAVDFVCADLEQPLATVRGAVLSVRTAPEQPMTEAAADAFLQTLLGAAGNGVPHGTFDDLGDARIPLIAVTGTNGKTTTTLAIAHIVRCAGLVTGVTTTEGVFIDGHPVTRGDCTGYFSARTVLTDPHVEAAVLETARGGMVKRGLAFDRSTVGVVLNVQGDHLGQDGIDTIEALAHLKGLVARTAGRAAVLNADDARCVGMATGLRPGCEAVYFSARAPGLAPSAVVSTHLAGGGRAVLLRRDDRGRETIVLCQGEASAISLALVERLPMTFGGLARHNVANALAAAAATWAAGFAVERIRAGLAGFRPSEAANPLRLNVFRVGGTTVVVDYAHNRGAVAAIAATARGLSSGRLIGIVSAPGDRIDEELDEVGRVAAQGFDEIVVYEKDDKRGRAAGEITRRIANGALGTGIDAARLHAIGEQRAAIRTGLAICGPDDLLVYAGATDVRDLEAAVAMPVEELVVVERRSPLVVDPPPGAEAQPSAAGPSERRVDRRPYLVPKSSAPSINTSR